MRRLNKTDYQLDDGRSVRITLTMLTPQDQLATANYLELDSVGYEINDDGTLVMDAGGAPIGIASRRVRIPLDGVREGRQSMQPGWVRVGDGINQGEEQLDALPETGDEGQIAVLNDGRYMYSFGLYDAARTSRLAEFIKPEPVAAADNTAFLASLEP